MPTDDEYIIRNGTFLQWLKYRVKFGSTVLPGYLVLLTLLLIVGVVAKVS